MGSVTLLRPDGSELQVDETDAPKLRVLGYKDKSGTQVAEQGVEQGQQEFYSTPLEKYRTFWEGANSGGSLGLTDMVLGDEGSANRARYNPGTRLGGEIAGTIVGSLEGVPTPVRGLEEVATLGGEALGGGSKIISGMVRGGIEGAGFGAGQAITTAKLDGDPLTAEAVLAGMGQGALWGGALSGVGEGIGARLEARAAREAEEKLALTEVEKEAQDALHSTKSRYEAQIADTLDLRGKDAATRGIEEQHFTGFNNSIRDAVETLNTTVKDAKAEVAQSKIDFTGIKMSNRKIQADLVEKHLMVAARPEARGLEKSLALAVHYAEKGEYESMLTHLEKFQEHAVTMESKLGGKQYFNAEKVVGQAEKLMGEAKLRVEGASNAVKMVAETKAVASALAGFPRTAEEFSKMQASKIERLAAAVDKLQGLKVGEFEGIKAAVAEGVDNLARGLGVTIEGTPGQKMAGLWKALKESRTSKAKALLESTKEGNLLWKKTEKAWNALDAEKAAKKAEEAATRGPKGKLLRYAGGALVGKQLGIGYPGYILGSQLVTGLMGLKGAVLGKISASALKYTPKAMKTLARVGPRLEPLARRLDGTLDESGKSRRLLMETRMREIADAAPAMRDTLYKAVSPLTVEHPEFAAAVHDTASARFAFLLSKMPKDPGNAYSKLTSIWKADPVEMEKFSRYYNVFHDPVEVVNRAIESGKVSYEEMDGLRNMNPELYNHLRVGLLERVSDPEVRANMGYHDQIHIGLLIGTNFHASMAPHFIAATQQMYTERNKPLEMNPQIQSGGGAGRPSGPGPSATSAQKIEQH